MWIQDNEKYALVGLQVKIDGTLQNEHLLPDLWALTDTTFKIPSHWRDWLGSIRADEVAGNNLFLFSKLLSATPGVLDFENETLKWRVWYFYVGLLLAAMFSPAHKAVMLTGARHDGDIDIRQKLDLDLSVPRVFKAYPAIAADDILAAACLGQKLDAMRSVSGSGELWRLNRTLDIYVRARAIPELLDRIHQYCRCIDGLILPDIGKTKSQFKSRTELFVGSIHHDLMGELYDIRSNVEHLHEYRYLEKFDRSVRLDLAKKEAIAEYIARTALARIVSQNALWSHFGNTAALEKFWALAPDARKNIWGDHFDPMASLAGFEQKNISDAQLGKP